MPATAWDILQRFTDAVRDRMPGMDIYTDDIVFEEDGKVFGIVAWWTEDNYKYLKIPFTFDADTTEVTLSDPTETVEVERTTQYVQFALVPGAQRFEATFDDDAYAIRGLVILRTGDYREGQYPIDNAWLDKALTRFEQLKTKFDYLPAVTLGHQSIRPAQSETPAIGYIDKMRKVGDELLADVVGISATLFHALKKGAYPYRSLEFFHKTGEIMRCAFLSHAPEVKTAPMIAPEYKTMFSGDLAECAVAVIQPDGAMEVDKMWNDDANGASHTHGNSGTDAEQITELELKTKTQAEKIAEQGAQLTKFASDTREQDVVTALDGLGVTPGVLKDPVVKRLVDQLVTLDTVTTFAAEDGSEVKQTPAEMFSAAVGSLVTLAKAGTLLKTPEELAASTPGNAGRPFGSNNEPTEAADGELSEFEIKDKTLVKNIEKLMAKDEITYPVAFERIRRMSSDELKQFQASE